jgi:hypothetical protein
MAAKAGFPLAGFEVLVSEDWMLQTRCIETACPPLSLSNESPVRARNGNFRCRDRATNSTYLAHIRQQRLRNLKNQARKSLTSRPISRVSLSHHNQGVWVEPGLEPGTHRLRLVDPSAALASMKQRRSAQRRTSGSLGAMRLPCGLATPTLAAAGWKKFSPADMSAWPPRAEGMRSSRKPPLRAQQRTFINPRQTS